MLAGCTGNSGNVQKEDGPKGAKENVSAPDPVKLTAAIDGPLIDDMFTRLITEKLKEKHPNISLQIVQPTRHLDGCDRIGGR